MMAEMVLYIIIGIICLIVTVVSIIFSVIAFANSKPSKFIWLFVFLMSLVGLVITIMLSVRTVINRGKEFAKTQIEQFENYADSLNTEGYYAVSIQHKQIVYLKNLAPENITQSQPDEFYTYLGYQDYHRYPLRFPYSLHIDYYSETAELFNEINVIRFDENDNGEVYAGLSDISRLAFDNHLLLLEQEVSSTRSNKPIKHFVLFEMDTEKKSEVISQDDLFKKAKEKGYIGPDTLMTIKKYGLLFQ